MTWVSGESSDNLRGSPSCTAVLDRHNNTCELIIHQRHVHIHTPTQRGSGDTDTSLFLDMKCSYSSWTFLFRRKEPAMLSWQREKHPEGLYFLVSPPHPLLSPSPPTTPLAFNIQQLSDLMRNLWMDSPAGILIWLHRFQPLVGPWDTITVRQHILLHSIHNG